MDTIKEKAKEWIEKESIAKNTYEVERAYLAGAKEALSLISSKLYDKRLEYEYQIENHPEGSIERIVVDCQFNTIYEAECIVKAN